MSYKYIDVLFHMHVGLASVVLTLFMQLASVTYASTGVIYQRVGDIAPALLKNSYLIKDSRPYFGQPAVDHPPTARASAIPGHLWLWGFLDYLKGQPLGTVLPVKHQYELVAPPLLADSLPSPEFIHEDHLDMLTQSYQSLSDDVSLNKILFESAPNLPASPLSSGSGGGDDDGDDGNSQNDDDSEPEPLNIVYGEKIWLAQVSAERLLSKTLKNKRRLLRIIHKKLQRAIAEGNSGLVKILGDRLMLIEVELDELERSGQQLDPVVLSRVKAAFASDQQELQDYDDRPLRLALPEHPATVNAAPDSLIIGFDEGRQVPNSDTQTDHSEKPSASQPSTSQTSTSRQAPISGSGLGEKRYARCLDGDDGGNGNPSHNGHTRNNHCPMCNNGPCEKSRWQPCTSETCTSEKRLRDSSGRTASYVDRGITNLPNEMVLKILSNLDLRTISVCRRVNSSWQALIDESHLPALAFCRALHYQSIPQTVKDYHSFTRGWLTGFGNKGKKLANELDKHLEDKYFPEMLFFAIAEVLTRTKLLTCQNVFASQHDERVSNARFSIDGHHLVTIFDHHTAKIWGLVDGQWQEKATIEHESWVRSARFSLDGHHLVTVSDDRTAKICGLVDGQWQEKAIIEHENWVRNARFSPDGHHLVIAFDGAAKIWGLVDGQWQEKATIKHVGWVRNARFSPDGHHLVTASWGKTAKIWGPVDGRWQEKATVHHKKRVSSARFSPDGHHLVTASIDNTAKIWGLVDGQWQEKATIRHGNRLSNVRFSPDGHHLVTASSDNTAKIWGLVDGQWQEKTTIKHKGWVRKVRFSPDGHHLVTASSDNTAKIWGLVNGQWQEKATIQHNEWVRYAHFSPDGHHLVTASEDKTAQIWGLVDGQWQKKATIRHNNWVYNASFSPDGHHLVTASYDKTAKIWGLVNGQWQEKATIQHGDRVINACFCPDGHHLVTASPGSAKIWLIISRE